MQYVQLFKYSSILFLIVQTTLFVLILRYSRKIPNNNESIYVSSTAVACVELIKLAICLLIIFIVHAKFSMTETLNQLNTEIVNKPKETLKLLIPALLYTLQNNLYFIALSNLDVVTYQVTYQLKIFATALFSYLILGKKLNIYKYLSLFILVVGVSLVQYSKTNEKKEFKSNIIGFISVFISCLTSGFTGVYFEKLLKSSNSGVCIRNIQLGVFGIIFSFLTIYTYDFKLVVNNGFFNGYNSIVWIVIFVQSIGGLTVAAVIKYADNILKEFATSVSIIVTSFVSYYLLNDFIPNFTFIIGSLFVLVSTFFYNYEKAKTSTIETDDNNNF